MEEIVEELFKQLQKRYSESRSNDFLMMLNHMFPSSISFALDLVDKRKVTLLTSKSGRALFQVIGTSGTPYLCLSEGSFCECPAYKFSVMKSGESLMCKHLLAVKLCQAMDCLNQLEVSEERMSEMLKSLE